jgi:ATP-binding cassette subfamily B protein
VRFLLTYARAHILSYLLGFAMLLATNWVAVRIPVLIGDSLNVLEDGGAQALRGSRGLALELMLLALILVVTRTLSRVLFFNPGRDVQFEVMRDLFGHLLTLQRPFYMRRKVGELVSVAANDTQSVRLLVGFAGLQVFNVAVAIPLHLHQMYTTDATLTWWCLIPIALGAVFMQQTIARFHKLVRGSLEVLASLSDRILESYSGISTVRAHGSEQAATRRFEQRNRAYLDVLLDVARIRAFAMPVLGFSGLIATGIVLWVGGNRVMAGEMRVGDLATLTTLLMSMVSLLTSLAWVLSAISRGTVALERVHDLVEESDDVPGGEVSLALTRAPRLEIRGLSFTYPDREEASVSDLSAVVEPGRVLGIFGHTGAGKTTLIDLISRVHAPEPGAILIDGHDVRDVDLASLRRGMAVVPQLPFLFSTTVGNNIRLQDEESGHGASEDARRVALPAFARRSESEAAQGEREASETVPDAELERVIRAACLEPDLQQLADGLETVVGERGVMLSGGQRQRTVLARALYRRPKLLLLDDILSAVDQATEAKLVDAIRDIEMGDGSGVGPTTVIVSHRASVLEHADEILVLDEGRVVERGTHAELIALGGRYADAHEHQRQQADAVHSSSTDPGGVG